ncbi:hypothetical protein ADUPG1_006720, partial [Aduncisulcus paluster]
LAPMEYTQVMGQESESIVPFFYSPTLGALIQGLSRAMVHSTPIDSSSNNISLHPLIPLLKSIPQLSVALNKNLKNWIEEELRQERENQQQRAEQTDTRGNRAKGKKQEKTLSSVMALLKIGILKKLPEVEPAPEPKLLKRSVRDMINATAEPATPLQPEIEGIEFSVAPLNRRRLVLELMSLIEKEIVSIKVMGRLMSNTALSVLHSLRIGGTHPHFFDYCLCLAGGVFPTIIPSNRSGLVHQIVSYLPERCDLMLGCHALIDGILNDVLLIPPVESLTIGDGSVVESESIMRMIFCLQAPRNAMGSIRYSMTGRSQYFFPMPYVSYNSPRPQSSISTSDAVVSIPKAPVFVSHISGSYGLGGKVMSLSDQFFRIRANKVVERPSKSHISFLDVADIVSSQGDHNIVPHFLSITSDATTIFSCPKIDMKRSAKMVAVGLGLMFGAMAARHTQEYVDKVKKNISLFEDNSSGDKRYESIDIYELEKAQASVGMISLVSQSSMGNDWL